VLVQARYGTSTLTEIEAIRFADTGTISLEDLRAAPGTEEVVTLLAGGTPTFLMPQAYAGPLALAYQFAGTAIDDVMRGTSRNDFAILGAGSDAADMGAGDDIADGGTGSNFLTGGEGRDVFFIDGRSLLPVWSCITDFVPGEEVALWGWQPGTSTGTWGEDGGVPGYLGATFYADIDGNGLVETAITLSGRTVAQAPTATASDGLLWFR
jgi:serralysin